MIASLYNPFKNFDFSPQTCFLTGQKLHSYKEEQIFVFPEWLMDRYDLKDKTFKMLEGSSLRYKDMKMPCFSETIKNAINPLEEEIEKAFAIGYEAVKEIPEERLFQWMAKLLYGVLYQDISIEKRKPVVNGKEFELPLFLQERFGKLHSVLQSLVCPMDLSGSKLWSIKVFKINISKDVFNYKDETTNLNFSLSMNDFGIVACLQDNGAVANDQKRLTDIFSDKVLHPVQFQEFSARFIYSNYLLTRYAEYSMQSTEEKMSITSAPLAGTEHKPLFSYWDEDMFAQVLVIYWKPWGIQKDDIILFGNSPISYLENNDTYEIIEPDSITLPF